jgi:hypothetical protein
VTALLLPCLSSVRAFLLGECRRLEHTWLEYSRVGTAFDGVLVLGQNMHPEQGKYALQLNE